MSIFSKIKSLFQNSNKTNIVIKEITEKTTPSRNKNKINKSSVESTAKKAPQNKKKLKKQENNNKKIAGNAAFETESLENAVLIENFTPEPWDAESWQPRVEEGEMSFKELNLAPQILRGIQSVGFNCCSQIQKEILPHALKGKDVNGRAQTGTGKTAAFLFTIFQNLMKEPAKPRKHGAPRALIMAPTRELVLQIEKDALALGAFTGIRILTVLGGMDYEKQTQILKHKYIDIVIATPGRILDHYKQKVIKLDSVEILVLDEADRMLDMGFFPDIRRIINAVPPKEKRQTMLFSATMSDDIMRLAANWTNEPIYVNVEPEQVTSANVEMRAYIITQDEKYPLLYNLLKKFGEQRVMIFSNRKDQVRRLTERLKAHGFSAGMLTGDLSQNKRISTLEAFRKGKIAILVATDVAGRGIHVDHVDTVYNYTLPNHPEDFVHRVGRTGRAGETGLSIAFATEEDSYVLPIIEEHIKEKLNYVIPEEELLKEPEKVEPKQVKTEKTHRKNKL